MVGPGVKKGRLHVHLCRPFFFREWSTYECMLFHASPFLLDIQTSALFFDPRAPYPSIRTSFMCENVAFFKEMLIDFVLEVTGIFLAESKGFSRWCSHQGCRRHLQACLREEPHMLAWKLLNAPPSLPLLDLQNYVSLSLFEDPWKEPEWWPCVVRDPSSYPIAASSKLIQSRVALWLHSCMPLSRWF